MSDMYRWGFQHARSGQWTHGVDRFDDLSSNVWHGFFDQYDNIDEMFVRMGVPDPNGFYDNAMACLKAERWDSYEFYIQQFGEVCADWSRTYEGTLAMLSYDRQSAYIERIES